MQDSTTPTPSEVKPPLLLKEHAHNGESRAFNISLRGWIAVIVMATYCYLCAHETNGTDKLKDVVVMVIGFYFATRQNSASSKS